MLTKDFAYELPDELIASYPAPNRTGSRLLVLHKLTGALQDRSFADLAQFIAAGDLVIVNDSKVMRARLYGHKDTGGKVEILIERIVNESQALAHVYVNKAPPINSWLTINPAVRAQIIEQNKDTGLYLLQFAAITDLTVADILAQYGAVPLPPYMKRAAETVDLERYQTVYATHLGSIAAPTAGLHFSEELINALQQKGVEFGKVTLHVGYGTFASVKTEAIYDHKMHQEWLQVDAALCAQVKATQQRGGKIICVGSTATRAVEAAAASGEIKPTQGMTDIFITPGYKFKVVDTMVTNFHIPESTLLMLVSAFANREYILNAYQHAIQNKYRFFSYGDAMLITDHANAL